MLRRRCNSKCHIFAVLQIVIFAGFVASQFPNVNKVYRIENASDGMHLTIQSLKNNSFAGVVGEKWFGYRDQMWKIKLIDSASSSYQLIPEKMQSNNRLSYYADPNKKYPQIQTWLFQATKNDKEGRQLVNMISKQCLTSFGRRKDVGETNCDAFQRNQKWHFREANL